MSSLAPFAIDTADSATIVSNDIVSPPLARQYTDADFQAAIDKKVALEQDTYQPDAALFIRAAKRAFVIRRDNVILPAGTVEVRVFVGNGISHVVQMDETETRGMRKVKEVRVASIRNRVVKKPKV
jgi:hypothetical protein